MSDAPAFYGPQRFTGTRQACSLDFRRNLQVAVRMATRLGSVVEDFDTSEIEARAEAEYRITRRPGVSITAKGGRVVGCSDVSRAASCIAPPSSLSYLQTSPPPELDAVDVRAAVPAGRVLLRASRASSVFKSRERGRVVECKPRLRRKGAKPPPRRPVSFFSERSRLGLLKTVNSLDSRVTDRAFTCFVTTTYAAKYPAEWQTWKKHLDTFRKRLERAYGRLGVVWKLEPQERGAPHFHLLVFFDAQQDLQAFAAWVSENWTDVADPDGVGRASSGVTRLRTDAGLVRSFGGVLAYAAKYLGQGDDKLFFANPETGEEVMPGRFWGVWRRELIMGAHSDQAADEVAAAQVQRFERRYVERVTGKKLAPRSSMYRAGAAYVAFVPEAIHRSLCSHFMPWQRLGISYTAYRLMELSYRRRRYIEACKEAWEYPPAPPDYEAGAASAE